MTTETECPVVDPLDLEAFIDPVEIPIEAMGAVAEDADHQE